MTDINNTRSHTIYSSIYSNDRCGIWVKFVRHITLNHRNKMGKSQVSRFVVVVFACIIDFIVNVLSTLCLFACSLFMPIPLICFVLSNCTRMLLQIFPNMCRKKYGDNRELIAIKFIISMWQGNTLRKYTSRD